MTLAADVRAVAPTIDEETVSNYVGRLQRLFIVESQRSWTPALRSRARVRTSPKLHLVDPALAAAALGAGSKQLRGDLQTLGTHLGTGERRAVVVRGNLSRRGAVAVQADTDRRICERYAAGSRAFSPTAAERSALYESNLQTGVLPDDGDVA